MIENVRTPGTRRRLAALLLAAAGVVTLVGCSTIVALLRKPPSVDVTAAEQSPAAPPAAAQPAGEPSPAGPDAPPPAIVLGPDGTIDFGPIWHLGQLYRSMRYDPLPVIHETWDPYYDELEVIDIAETDNRYILGTLAAQKRQEIVIRGTANLANALSDVAFAKYRDPELGIFIHRGFLTMARILEKDILPRLRPGYELVLFGHSLGAAEAVILGMLLADDGQQIGAIYSSGQPRVTDAAGCARLDRLPIVRIISDSDPVPLVPPQSFYREDPYRHAGSAIVLLDGPYFCVLGERMGDQELNAEFAAHGFSFADLRKDIDRHFMVSYLQREAGKLVDPVQVPWADRHQYLAGNGAGGGLAGPPAP
jgi:hypothetical protein